MELAACIALIDRSAREVGAVGVTEPPEKESEAVLDLTRAVAHSVERKAGPIVLYALGLASAGLDEPVRLRLLTKLAEQIAAAATG